MYSIPIHMFHVSTRAQTYDGICGGECTTVFGLLGSRIGYISI